MTEYKAGDRVLIKDDAVEDGWLKPGEEGTISEFDECASYCEGHLIFRNEDGDVSNYDLDEVTLRPAPFKVGDKVKILKDSNSSRLKPGEVVTLKSQYPSVALWEVEENNSDGWSPNVREMDFEAYTEPEERKFQIGDEVVRTGPHTLFGEDDFEYDRESDLGDRGVLVENIRNYDGEPSTYYKGDVRIKWTQGKTAGRTSQINPASLTLASAVADETVSDFKVGQVYEWVEGARRYSQAGLRFRLTDVDTLAQEVTYEYLTGSLVGATSIFKVPFDVLAENRLVTDHIEETTEIVDIWDTESLKDGDVVVREESLGGWGEDITPAQVERKVVKAPEPAPEPEPHRNDLPTEEGSSVKFTGWRHATLTYTRDEPQTLQWVFVSGVPVKEIFDPFTTENEFEVKYDAGK